MFRLKCICVSICVVLAVSGCGDDGSSNNGDAANNGNNGKGDTAGDIVCEVANRSGRDVDFTQLGDPIAEFIFSSGDSCPEGYAATIDKLREFDSEGCDSGPTSGMETFVVSETAQIMGEPTSYRTVTTRECGDREQHGLFFSLFGVRPQSSLPDNMEVMSFDESAGVYNYYAFERGEWNFFGDSNDLIHDQGGRCKDCHTGGGPIMKELDTPWLHWEGHEDTPGASELVSANEDLGRHGSNALTLEGVVEDGNEEWNETRLTTLLAEADTRELLKPLFCSVEANLDTATDFAGRPVRDLPTDLFFDPHIKRFGGDIAMTEEVYQKVIDEANQRVPGISGENDTIFKLPYPERAHTDNHYVDLLVERGIVDDAFVKDVLMVEFTRPVFSDARCDLLEFAPEPGECCKTCSAGQACGDSCISADATCDQAPGCACGDNGPFTADRIRQGFIDNLNAASPADGSAAARLLAHLENDADEHDAAVDDFISACEARPQEAFMRDALAYVTSLRRRATSMHVFEFPQTMPRNDLSPSSTARLDPETCELID